MILVYPKRDARVWTWSSFFLCYSFKRDCGLQASSNFTVMLPLMMDRKNGPKTILVGWVWQMIFYCFKRCHPFFYDLYSTFRWLFFIIHCTIMIQINYYLMIFLYSIVTFFSWAISTVKSSKLCIIIHNFKILISL